MAEVFSEICPRRGITPNWPLPFALRRHRMMGVQLLLDGIEAPHIGRRRSEQALQGFFDIATERLLEEGSSQVGPGVARLNPGQARSAARAYADHRPGAKPGVLSQTDWWPDSRFRARHQPKQINARGYCTVTSTPGASP
jgi:hypothetical protein